MYLSPLTKVFLILLTATVLGACAGAKEWRYPPTGVDDELAIYIINHGWHTGIAISRENLGEVLAILVERLGDQIFYEVGWGDMGFYQAEKITSGIAARALIWPTDGVMHVAALPKHPKEYFPQSKIVQVKLSKTAHGFLNRAIAASFRRDNTGWLKPLGKGLYARSLFFEAEGIYYATNTCNTWTARMLQEAGMPIRTFMTLTAGSVMRQTEKAVVGRTKH